MGYFDIAGALHDPTQDLMQGYNLGTNLMKTQQAGQLAGLASQAMGQYGDQRQQTLQSMARLDPSQAMDMHDKLMQNDQNYVSKAAQAARYVLSATQTGNPADAENAFQAIKPTMDQYAKITGKPFPDHFDPSMIPAMQALVGSQGNKIENTLTDYTGKTYGLDAYGNKTDLGIQQMPKGAQLQDAKMYDQSTGQEVPVKINPITRDVYNEAGQLIKPGQGAGLPQAVPQGQAQGGGAYGNAIAGIESRGSGNYAAVGPATSTGDRAYGRYQVMGVNIPQWTQAILGHAMTPQQFISDPQAQDAVFNAKYGEYVQKYGPEGAARAWFGGPGNVNNPNAKDVNGMTVGQYGQKFISNLNQSGQQQPQGQPQQGQGVNDTVSYNGQTLGFSAPTEAQKNKILADQAVTNLGIKPDSLDYKKILMGGQGALKDVIARAGGDNLDLYQQLTPAGKEVAKMIVARQGGNNPFANLRGNDKINLEGAVHSLDPTINLGDIEQTAKYRNGLASTDITKPGGQIQSYNTAIGHLGEMIQANNGLNKDINNSTYPIVNSVMQAVSKNAGSASVTQWNQAKAMFSTELAKMIKGGVPGEAEAQEIMHAFDSANSPQQRNAALATAAKFMMSRVDAAENTMQNNLGEIYNGNSVVTGQNQRIVNSIYKNLAHEDLPQWRPANNGRGFTKDLRSSFPQLFGDASAPTQSAPLSNGPRDFSHLWGQ